MSRESGYGRAPFNTIAHSKQQWTERDRDFVTPANDLLYSNAWVDLRHGPVTLDIEAPTRFFVVEILDVYTNNFLNLGTRNVPSEGARYTLVGPGSSEVKETNIIRCPSSLVWILARVLVDNEADLPAALKMQAGIQLNGPRIETPVRSLTEWQDSGDAAMDFFGNLARALADFPPPDSQRAPFEFLAAAHIKLTADGAFPQLRQTTVEGLQNAYSAGMAMIEGHTRSPSKAPWRYSTRLGRFGNDYMLRAATAFKGIAALSADEAVYATSDYDQNGDPLHGGRMYRIRFPDGGDLPADAFWSISLYGADRFFVGNPLGRHALGNRSNLVSDADGSLTICVSHREPPGPRANWLPAPDATFYLILRLYHPQERLLRGTYHFPEVERLT